ncbi:MAG: SurA N-terminal domain-containing protein [Desulfitobacteriia bacterium]|jgi:foldase protein PrsA
MNKNITICITVIIIIVAIFVGMYNQFFNKTVAKVEGHKISQRDLYNYMFKESGEQALNNLISEKIVDLEAQKNNITVTEEEVQEKIDFYKDVYGGEKALLSALKASGVTMEELEDNIRVALKITKLLAPKITITEEEIVEFYEENKEVFLGADQKPSLEENKERVRAALLEQKAQAEFTPWMTERLAYYKIERL